jgi:hypothetical protein
MQNLHKRFDPADVYHALVKDCQEKDLRITELETALRYLVDAVEQQGDELDPTNDLMRAVRDAKSWLGKTR